MPEDEIAQDHLIHFIAPQRDHRHSALLKILRKAYRCEHDCDQSGGSRYDLAQPGHITV